MRELLVLVGSILWGYAVCYGVMLYEGVGTEEVRCPITFQYIPPSHHLLFLCCNDICYPLPGKKLPYGNTFFMVYCQVFP